LQIQVKGLGQFVFLAVGAKTEFNIPPIVFTTAYYYADGKLCYAIDFNGNSYLLDNNLNQLEELLSPQQFFRVNRQLLVNIKSIKKVHTWLGGRLKLELSLPAQADTIVSRERVCGFKDWLG